ncbi:DUF2169 domain-containing protein [Bordetella genomosp. 13]|uniref:DUF2169 domain-containing protein n=1 Tax=Bordetella genomosp. 13 TaxID=463040 RepID=UPI0011A8B21C|nr:DUF2169 domain-containing protein [Bordetella genomosp. 13]
MKTIKPFRLTSLHRPYSWRKRNFLSVAIFALADLRDPRAPKLLTDMEVWREVMPELDCDGVIDHVLPKTVPEFLVGGHAYTAHQDDKTKVMVRAEVGGLQKELLVFGDRYLIGDRPTDPAPFDSMPMSWSRAFGGPAFAENPAGTGIEPVDVNGQRLVRYPNIEHGTDRYQRGQRNGTPYSLGPINMMYPRRFGLMGTYSERWKMEEFPGFFPDMNPLIFNAAEPDQRWPDRAELPLGEAFAIWNMHPALRCWEGTLPRWHARAFIRRKAADGQAPAIDEVEMRATTAWFVPHQERVLLIYHGNIEVEEDDASDVLSLMSALEAQGAERPAEHYADIMRLREDPETGGMHVMCDDELITASILGSVYVDTDAVYQTPTWIKSQLYKHRMVAQQRQEIASYGQDPDEFLPDLHGPERRYGPGDLPELAREMAKQKEEAARLKEQLERQSADLKAQYERQGMPVPDTDSRPSGPPKALLELLGQPDMLASLVKPGTGEVDFSLLGKLVGDAEPLAPADYRQPPEYAEFVKRNPQTNTSEATAWTQEPAFQRQMRSMKPLLHKSYLYSAHWQDAALKLDTEQNRIIRELVQEKYQRGESLSELDLTGCALPKLGFENADFSRSFLENSDLSDCTFRDCDFTECVLARADLSNSRFVNCTFERANLSLAKLYNVCFENCAFKESVIENADFEECVIQGGLFDSLMPNKVRLLKCRLLGGAHFRMSIFNEADLSDCRLEDVRFEKVSFQNGRLADTVFDGAHLDGGSFFITTLSSVFFHRCQISNTAFVHQTRLDACSFESSSLKQCNFRETPMQSVNFEDARIELCDFSLADLSNANLRNSRAANSLYTRATLVHSDLSHANLMGSDFKAADLRHADLSVANLFRTNFALGKMDDSTALDGAYKKEVNLYPLRQAKAS